MWSVCRDEIFTSFREEWRHLQVIISTCESLQVWSPHYCRDRKITFLVLKCTQVLSSNVNWNMTAALCFYFQRRAIILIFRSFILILDSYGAAKHNWLNYQVCRSTEKYDSCSLFLVFSAFSQNGLCWLLLPLSLMRLCTLLYSHKNTARTLIKCYLQLTLLTLNTT